MIHKPSIRNGVITSYVTSFIRVLMHGEVHGILYMSVLRHAQILARPFY